MVVLCPSASVATTLPSSPPVTTRAPSAAVARIAPPWTGTLRGSPARGANTSAPSPSTKTAVCPRKCAATTGAPALTGRLRSTTEGILARVSLTLLLRPHPEEGACKVGDVRCVAPVSKDEGGLMLRDGGHRALKARVCGPLAASSA